MSNLLFRIINYTKAIYLFQFKDIGITFVTDKKHIAEETTVRNIKKILTNSEKERRKENEAATNN